MVLQLLDLAPGLEDAEVVLDAPAQRIPLEDARRIVGTSHGHGGEDEPLQRLGLRRRALLAGVHHPQLDRRRLWARQRHRLVAQRRLGEARGTLVLGSLFAGLHPRAQPIELDGASAAGRGVAHLVEQAARDPVPLGRGVLAEDAVDLRTHQQLDVRGVRALFDEQVKEVGGSLLGIVQCPANDLRSSRTRPAAPPAAPRRD